LGEPIFHVPAIVKEVFSNGNIKVNWKEDTSIYGDDIILNNKFKVVNQKVSIFLRHSLILLDL
jgi:hypothetical protein